VGRKVLESAFGFLSLKAKNDRPAATSVCGFFYSIILLEAKSKILLGIVFATSKQNV
jgi:hypothetical protein